MSPRPRKVSDEEVFAATYRAMSRLSPSELTLAAIAAEAGVTAGALVQRFGSKRDLLLALSDRYSSGTSQMFADLRKANPSPISTLRAYGDCLSQMAVSPAALARSLSYLQIDLTDPDFRKHLEVQARLTRSELQALIKAAVGAKELLRNTDARQLARTVEAVLTGSMMAWAHYQEGAAAEWMRADLEAVLAPFLPTRTKKRTKRTKPSK
ncbi:MAG: TetR/AcrR family transcriptional regulator [Vicinamibacterales bacterium]